MAISRNIVENRKVPGTSIGPAGRGSITFGMDRPQTLESLRRNILPPRGMPAPMSMPLPRPMPNPRFPMPSPGPRGPMPMPMPAPKYDFFNPPPGMGPFRQQPFPDRMPRGQRSMPDFMDMNPEQEGIQLFAMPAAATIDPSDYRTIIKMIEQGLDPEDYMNRGGIASLLE